MTRQGNAVAAEDFDDVTLTVFLLVGNQFLRFVVAVAEYEQKNPQCSNDRFVAVVVECSLVAELPRRQHDGMVT